MFTRIYIVGASLLLIGLKCANAQPLSIDSAENYLHNTYENANWKAFAVKMEHLRKFGEGLIPIVHLGDSHIQGGYFTNTVRGLLNKDFGVSSRGWVFPYSLAKTNGAEDVAFYSQSDWNYLKYNRVRPFHKTNVSGYELESSDSLVNLSLTLKQQSDILYPFHELQIFGPGGLAKVNCKAGEQTTCEEISKNIYRTTLQFNKLSDSAEITIRHHGAPFQIFGLRLLRDKPGIIYDVLGINGVGYETFDRLIDYQPFVKALHPDCIIVSLGTNDAYVQRLDTLEIKRHIRAVIDSLKDSNPGACLVLTTVGDYRVHKIHLNPNIILINEAIISMAIKEHCVYWDFFKVMGGLGSSIQWARHGLFYKDMLHLSKEGYKYQGELFYKAFSTSLAQTDYDK